MNTTILEEMDDYFIWKTITIFELNKYNYDHINFSMLRRAAELYQIIIVLYTVISCLNYCFEKKSIKV